MPTWLLVLLVILIIFAIITFAYFIFVLRRISIVAKKTDYLVEDITYKSEKMNDVISSIVKIANYINAAEELVKNNADTISNLLNNERNKSKPKKTEKKENE